MIVSGMRERGGAIDDFFATSSRQVFENEASLPRGSHPLDQLNRLETQDFEDMVRPPTKLADSSGEQRLLCWPGNLWNNLPRAVFLMTGGSRC